MNSTTPPAKAIEKWSKQSVIELFKMPFGRLISMARGVFEQHFDVDEIQVSTLLSIKTGGCPENCSYCPQSARYNTNVKATKMMSQEEVVQAAKAAKASGASRFCMGAAWRGPRDKDLDKVIDMIKAVKDLGLETCATLGLLNKAQADKLAQAGLDYYNHNIDCSQEFYEKIISTRTFKDRIQTLEHVGQSGVKICCGGILGMGETVEDRASMLALLGNMRPTPDSVPINKLIKVKGTPMEWVPDMDPLDFIRAIAVTRIVLPRAYVRLSAGRDGMSNELQAFCFFVGANSVFYGEKLLTCDNPAPPKDMELFKQLQIKVKKAAPSKVPDSVLDAPLDIPLGTRSSVGTSAGSCVDSLSNQSCAATNNSIPNTLSTASEHACKSLCKENMEEPST